MRLRTVRKSGLAIGSLGFGVMAAFAVLGLGGCHSAGSDAVATINGTPISSKDFVDYIMRKKTVLVASRAGDQQMLVAQDQILGQQALEDLVKRQLMLNLAKECGVNPSPDDVEKEINFQRTVTPNLLQDLARQGIPLDLLKRDIELDLAEYRIVTQGITVTPADVDQYIKEHPTEFRNPPTARTLFVVVSSPGEKKQVDDDLATGQDFQNVSLHYSKAPNARSVGVQFPITDMDKMDANLKQEIESTPEGKTTPWITAGANMYAKLYVQAKSAPTPINIDTTIREEVRRKIAMAKGQKAMDLNTRLLAEFKKSNIEVQMDALKPSWKAYTDSLNAAQTPAGGPNATASPSTTITPTK